MCSVWILGLVSSLVRVLYPIIVNTVGMKKEEKTTLHYSTLGGWMAQREYIIYSDPVGFGFTILSIIL